MKSDTLDLSRLRDDAIRFRWAFMAMTLIALIARAQAITEPMYSVDGYSFLNSPDELRSLVMAQGRWGEVAIRWLRTKIGYVDMGVVPSALIVSTVCFVAAAFLYARILLTKIEMTELLIFFALFTLHPYNTEFFTFSEATLYISLSIFLAAAALAFMEPAARRWLGVVFGGVLMLFALSIYQLVLAHAVIVCLLSIVGRTAGSDLVQAQDQRWRHLVFSPPVRSLLAVVLVFMVYLLTIIFISRMSGIALTDRAELSGFPDLKERLSALSDALSLVFWPKYGLVPLAVSVLLIAILAISVVAILVRIILRRGVGAALVSLLLVATATVCSVAIPVAAHVVSLPPRVLSPFSILTAGIAVLGWRFTPATRVRSWAAVALAVLVIAYVGASNRILFDQHLVNLWDAQEANRIVARFEANPHYADMRVLALVHGNWRRTAPLPTVSDDMNVSAFAGQYSKFGVIERTTGLRFAIPTKVERAVAEKYCRSASPWPSADSVTITDGLGIVCMPIPE